MLRIVSLFLVGIVAGRLVDIWFAVAFVYNDLPAAEWVRQMNLMDASHGLNMPALGVLTIASIAPLFPLERDWTSRRAALTWVGLGLGLASMAIVILWSFPMNLQIRSWTGSTLPADWADVRRLWFVTQTVKTLCATLSFATLLAAAFTPSPSR